MNGYAFRLNLNPYDFQSSDRGAYVVYDMLSKKT